MTSETKLNYIKILRKALSIPCSAPSTPSGSGRVYVAISEKHRRGIAAAAKKIGLLYTGRDKSQCPHALYIGYDNATGWELARGTVIATALNSEGIQCYDFYLKLDTEEGFNLGDHFTVEEIATTMRLAGNLLGER